MQHQLQIVAIVWKSIVRTAMKGHMLPKAQHMEPTTRNQEQSMAGPIGNILTGKMQSGTTGHWVNGLLVKKVDLEVTKVCYIHR